MNGGFLQGHLPRCSKTFNIGHQSHKQSHNQCSLASAERMPHSRRTCMRPLYDRSSCCCLCSSFDAFSARRCSCISIRFSFLTCALHKELLFSNACLASGLQQEPWIHTMLSKGPTSASNSSRSPAKLGNSSFFVLLSRLMMSLDFFCTVTFFTAFWFRNPTCAQLI